MVASIQTMSDAVATTETAERKLLSCKNALRLNRLRLNLCIDIICTL